MILDRNELFKDRWMQCQGKPDYIYTGVSRQAAQMRSKRESRQSSQRSHSTVNILYPASSSVGARPKTSMGMPMNKTRQSVSLEHYRNHKL